MSKDTLIQIPHNKRYNIHTKLIIEISVTLQQ